VLEIDPQPKTSIKSGPRSLSTVSVSGGRRRRLEGQLGRLAEVLARPDVDRLDYVVPGGIAEVVLWQVACKRPGDICPKPPGSPVTFRARRSSSIIPVFRRTTIAAVATLLP
jgi:hypothetical protein